MFGSAAGFEEVAQSPPPPSSSLSSSPSSSKKDVCPACHKAFASARSVSGHKSTCAQWIAKTEEEKEELNKTYSCGKRRRQQYQDEEDITNDREPGTAFRKRRLRASSAAASAADKAAGDLDGIGARVTRGSIQITRYDARDAELTRQLIEGVETAAVATAAYEDAAGSASSPSLPLSLQESGSGRSVPLTWKLRAEQAEDRVRYLEQKLDTADELMQMLRQIVTVPALNRFTPKPLSGSGASSAGEADATTTQSDDGVDFVASAAPLRPPRVPGSTLSPVGEGNAAEEAETSRITAEALLALQTMDASDDGAYSDC